MKEVIIYTDGACKGNPGPGGYAAVLIFKGQRKEVSGGFRLTTNNRMELMAVISALEALKEASEVRLHTDSKYVVDNLNSGAAQRWRAMGWKRDRKNKALNPDLWGRLLDLTEKHQIRFVWVQGHAGDPLNEYCDQLSNAIAGRRGLPEDPGYQPKPKALRLF